MNRTALLLTLMLTLTACNVPTAPAVLPGPTGSVWTEQDSAGFRYELRFDNSMSTATVTGDANASAPCAVWVAGRDTLRTIHFVVAPHDTLWMNLWIHGDTLRGDIIHGPPPGSFWWVWFLRQSTHEHL